MRDGRRHQPEGIFQEYSRESAPTIRGPNGSTVLFHCFEDYARSMLFNFVHRFKFCSPKYDSSEDLKFSLLAVFSNERIAMYLYLQFPAKCIFVFILKFAV